MKHNVKITAILIAMFIAAQLIGLVVIGLYANNELPYGLQPPEMTPQVSIINIVVAMIFAIFLIFLLMKIKAALLLRFWFFAVVAMALAVCINAFIFRSFAYAPYIAFAVALPFAYIKIFKRNLLVHNFSELLIYPGIAAVFVPMLSIWAVVILLVVISVYDMYAVWYSGFMQKMAKYQMDEIKVFAGFFVPYLNPKQRAELQKAKESKKNLKEKRMKVSLAILGGGDVVFPLIMAGVVMLTKGIFSALTITLFATLSLLFLFILARKGKFYPAMPFLSVGCFVGLAVSWLIFI